MHIKSLLLATASAALVSAQQNNSLTALLNSTAELSTLNSILGNQTELLATLQNATNITIFAPNNAALDPIISSEAFTQQAAAQPMFVASLLLYHIVNGSFPSTAFAATPKFLPTFLIPNTTYTTVSGGQVVEARLAGENVTLTSGLGSTTNVTTANINMTNGVIHIVDNVLQIPENVSTTALAADLTSLVGALNATNLTDTIDTASDITIFAPTNAAFQDIASVLATLNASAAAGVLDYHVLNGTIAYSYLLTNTTATTLSGAPLNITVSPSGAVFINSARVVAADILVAGGVIHVIDAVLNPNGTAAPDSAATTAVVAYPGASTGTEVPYTSGITATTTNSALVRTTGEVASGYTAAPSGALSSASASASAAASSASSSAGAAVPTAVGAMGAAALFGGAACLANL